MVAEEEPLADTHALHPRPVRCDCRGKARVHAHAQKPPRSDAGYARDGLYGGL